ncbi:hypothetical protein LWI29_036276 [Acer saccharum]|uniref:Knottins-like domain-containing protein n=1 Tax=Acer saccharum TaxID=4024 RepID=A0AA39S1S0_ACESA|nr:hypothetical protein LWI29_036276 [Acer saccharum]KAK1559168.1 hypothetical protein Q3G72_011419 [Acer saccharum]
MAKSSHYSAILLVFVLIAIPEMMMTTVEAANICEKPSQTWSGKCGNTGHCDNQCKDWEHASHGACHKRDNNWKCFCYFECKKKENHDGKIKV